MRSVRLETRGLLLAVAFSAACLGLYVSASREIAAPGLGLALMVVGASGLVLLGVARRYRPMSNVTAVADGRTGSRYSSSTRRSSRRSSSPSPTSPSLIVHAFGGGSLGDRRLMEHGEPRPLYGPGILAGLVVAVLVTSGLRRFLWGGHSSGRVGLAHRPGRSPGMVGDAHPTRNPPESMDMAHLGKSIGRPLVCLLALGLGPTASAEWKAGVARVDTSPTSPVRMAGYAARTKPSAGIEHPLFAKALALSDAGGHKVVLVTCDILWFRRPFTERVAARVKEKHGIPRQDLVLFASHTHAGPTPVEADEPAREGFEANVAYTKDLEDKVVGVIDEALGKMEAVTITYGVGRAHFALNRREPTERGIRLGKNPQGPTDESVPILRVAKGDGKPLTILFGYACHNTTLRPDMMQIDPDYAGYAQDRVEADNPGAVAMFVTGCAGDADPHPFGTLAMAKDHGQHLGEAVKLVLDHPKWMTALDGPLRTAYTEATLRFGGPTDRASYEKRLGDPDGGRKVHAKKMIEEIDGGRPIRTEYPNYPVQAIAFGNRLTLLALSGEVVVDYAIRLGRELGGEGRALWVAAYANDVVGYVPSLRVLREGGYEGLDSFYHREPWPAPWAEDVEEKSLEATPGIVQGGRETDRHKDRPGLPAPCIPGRIYAS